MAEKATIARPYAKAAFEHALEHKSFARWSEVLAATAAVVQDGLVSPLLSNPRVTPSQIAAFIAEICGESMDENSRNFIGMLAGNRRLSLLPQIAEIYEKLRAEQENVADVQVTSAVALDGAQRQRLSAALQKRLERDVRLHCHVDEKLIGGAIVRSGDFVIDGSLKARLDRLASDMTH
jgi:F-type H+-transporting ATPase subunit delta